MEINEFTAKVMPVKDRLFRFAKRMLNNHDEAEDVVQDVLMKLWINRESLEKKQSVEAFAMAMTKNLCIDRFRSKHFQTVNSGLDIMELNLQEMSASPHKKAELADAMNLVAKIVEQLPENLKMIVQLRDIEGLSYQEIAEIMDMNINTLKVNLSRARKKIREFLNNNYNYYYNEA